MKTIKNFGVQSWVAVVGIVIVTGLLDAHAYMIIQESGGVAAWMECNSLWDCACAYLFVWHFFMGVCMWCVWICNEE